MKYRVPAVGLVAALLLGLGAGQGVANVPQKINYQGKLADSGTGAPLSGQHSVVLKLYDGAVGGDTLWTEGQTVAADSQGVFTCILGAAKPIAVSLGNSCWLEVEVDGQILQPRRELVSVPYALAAGSADHALSADSLGGIAASAFPDGYSLDAADGDPADAVYVDNSGNVGIGTLTPARKLHILGEGPRVLIEGSAGNPELNFENTDDASAQRWAIYKHFADDDLRFYQNGDRVSIQNGTGNVGIGTTSPGSYKLYVNGEAYCTGSWNTSDARLKTGLEPIGDALSMVAKLRGLSFLWRTADYPDRGFPAGRHYGLVAQEVEQVLPEVVKEGADGEKAVAYSELIPVLVESIKELKAESDGLRAASEALRAENDALRARLDALEKSSSK